VSVATATDIDRTSMWSHAVWAELVTSGTISTTWWSWSCCWTRSLMGSGGHGSGCC